MPAPKLRPGRAEHDHAPAGHVLAPVVADPLGDRQRARVADAEALADHAAQEDLAARRAVGDDVAGDHLLLGGERRRRRRAHDQAAAGQALAEVVVGVAGEAHRHAARHERPEALPGRPGELDVDRAVGQPLAVPALGDLVPEHRADGAVDVADRQVDHHRRGVLDRRAGEPDQLDVERVGEAVVLGHRLEQRLAVRVARRGEDRRQVEARRLPVVDGRRGCRASRRGRSSRPSSGSRARPSARAPRWR